MSQTLRVTELWRYPAKSLQGERLDAAMVTGKGLDSDRRYAIVDLDTGLGLTARRVPELLFASASLTADGRVRNHAARRLSRRWRRCAFCMAKAARRAALRRGKRGQKLRGRSRLRTRAVE
jgi:uncharacterized protein YcbX